MKRDDDHAPTARTTAGRAAAGNPPAMTQPAMGQPAMGQPAMGQPHAHESARAQVAGSAHYIDDLPEVKGTLYAAPILSTVAHGRLESVDTQAALNIHW